MVIAFRIKENTEFVNKIEDLSKDLRNIPSHVFGEHKCCTQLWYFKCQKKENEENSASSMRLCGLFQDIETRFNRLIQHASSLITNMDNKLA